MLHKKTQAYAQAGITLVALYASDVDTLTSGFLTGGGSQQGGETTEVFTITDLGVKPASSTDAVTSLSTDKTVSLVDNKGNIVKIPKNFGIAYDSGDNVAEGIVIEYTGNDALKGNQYVWVPVGQSITKSDGTTSAKSNHGYYIARYEAGSGAANRGLNQSMLNTGNTGDGQCKINDMAKNVREWSIESSNSSGTSNPCVGRGGYYISDLYFTADRDFSTTDASYDDIGFRPILYI